VIEANTAQLEFVDVENEYNEQLQTHALTGTVRDAETGIPVLGSVVIVLETGQGAATGPDGEFTILNVASGNLSLQARVVGYQPLQLNLPVFPEDQAEAADALLKLNQERIEETIAVHQSALEHMEAIADGARLEIANLKAVVTTDGAGNRFQTVSGVVRDADNDQVLPGAHVYLAADANTGTSTDMQGEFTISKVPLGQHKIQAAFVGYETIITEAIGNAR